MESRTKKDFRQYSTTDKVAATYKKMHQHQTSFFVGDMKKKYASVSGYTDSQGNKILKPLLEAFAELDKIIDESDPDNHEPQIYHAYQTGEALKAYCDPENPSKLKSIPIKSLFSEAEWETLPTEYQTLFNTDLQQLYPKITDWSWLPLVGFLHDLGKVLAAKPWGELPQWAVVGDTFPVGAPFSMANVYAEQGFFKKNYDINITDTYPGFFGKYKQNCGFNQVDMSWGHDEYGYAVLNRVTHYLPKEALYIIRYHSFYPWHTPRNGQRGYTELANHYDWMMLPLLKAFQKSDLYSKADHRPNPAELHAFYIDLVKKFMPGCIDEQNEINKPMVW